MAQEAYPTNTQTTKKSQIHCYLQHPTTTNRPNTTPHPREPYTYTPFSVPSFFLFVISGVSDNMNLVVLALVLQGALAGNLVEELEKEPELSLFLEMVEKAGFLDTLKSEGPLSVIAPMNSGFRFACLFKIFLKRIMINSQETTSPRHSCTGQWRNPLQNGEPPFFSSDRSISHLSDSLGSHHPRGDLVQQHDERPAGGDGGQGAGEDERLRDGGPHLAHVQRITIVGREAGLQRNPPRRLRPCLPATRVHHRRGELLNSLWAKRLQFKPFAESEARPPFLCSQDGGWSCRPHGHSWEW